MQGDLIQGLQTLLPTLAAVLILVALALLWRARHSVWLIVAIVAEAFGLVLRGVLFVAPDVMRTVPMLATLWMLAGVVFAIALLAYAIEVTQRP